MMSQDGTADAINELNRTEGVRDEGKGSRSRTMRLTGKIRRGVYHGSIFSKPLELKQLCVD